jgi:hypothetical protein
MSRSSRRPIPAGLPEPPDRPFRPADRILVIVILLIAAVLAVAGVPTATTLELLAGAGAVATRLAHPKPQPRRGAG